ncbi:MULTISPECIES: LamG-like jellyroll fold domain-containing protein [unclassified Streptomyces]|uniref:LamG-like jellyroll fold domain-containing protein n=1 Tax=unclassified Streptomyces TaxID=2593676 RepID=UPI002E280C48|nr:LamG-like jellyroll fold domain-containing protein [Streptomyces sp. NBC_00223]
MPLDTTLQVLADGSVRPKAAAADVTFSGGGASAPLATVSRNGTSYSVSAPWTLPVPTVSGSVATYESVLPDVDLLVTAVPDGFTENVVVKSREAAQNPELASLRFPVSLQGLDVRGQASGGAVLVDDQGRPVFSTGAALAWDSDSGGTGGEPATERMFGPADTEVGPGPGSKTSVMDVDITATAMTVTPDQDFLTDPATVYPVVLDPQTTSSSLAGWTALWSNASMASTSFWKTTHSLGVGYEASVDNKKVRSLYQFDTHVVDGKKVLQATFTAEEIWSANCTAKPVDLWSTGAISSSSTWNKQPSWKTKVDTVTVAKGWSSSCPGGNVEFDATHAIQDGTTTTVGLRASDESDPIAWKQFASPSDTKPTLSVTYVSAPATPTALKLSDPNVACGPRSGLATNIRSLTPTLTATPKSADGSQATLRSNFELYRFDPDIPDPKVASGSSSAWTASGTAGTWKTPTLQNGQTYWFRARTEYKYTFKGVTASMYSGWTTTGVCAFHIDTSKVLPPTVTSTAYPECASADDPDTCTAHGGVGAPGAFTLTAGSPNVVKYTYTLNGGALVTKSFSSPTASTAVTLSPNALGLNALTVETENSAGATSVGVTYFFRVAPGAPAVDHWAFDEGTGASAADSAGTHPASLSTGAAWSDRARTGKALATDGTASYASVASPGLDTSKSFTVSAWARLTGTSHNAVVAAQAGVNGSAYALYYSTAYQKWIFNRYTSDVASPTIVRSVATTSPAVGAWTHLLGVYDAQAQTIQLYVNGLPQGNPVAFTTPWAATGAMQIGRGQLSTSFTDYFPGQIDEVQLWNRILSPDEVAGIQDMTDPATGLARPALVSDWELNESSGGTAADSSGYGHAGTLGSGATWTDDLEGSMGNVLSLDGTAASYVSVPGPIVDSQGDFTVSVWVYLDPDALANTSTAHTMRIAGQSGTTRDSWGLWYTQAAGQSDGHWVFGRTSADTTAATTTTSPGNVTAGRPAVVGQWTMLTGVYDAANGRLQLYVNAQPSDATGDDPNGSDTGGGTDFTSSWQATGTFSIGRGRTNTGAYGDPVKGMVAKARVWTGLVSWQDVVTLFNSEEPPPAFPDE